MDRLDESQFKKNFAFTESATEQGNMRDLFMETNGNPLLADVAWPGL